MNKKELQRKINKRVKRKTRVRGKIFGTQEVPRVSIFKSNKHIYAQAIDDVAGHTLAFVDGAKLKLGANAQDAVKVASNFAKTLQEKNITTIVFDKNGYKYHGVIKAFADELRNNSIKF